MSGLETEGLTGATGPFRLGPVDFEVPPGGTLVVLGRSGAGKTTLLRLLGGFLPAESGRLRLGGSDRTRELPERRALGYVPQGLGLLPHRTVEGNIAYPLEIRGDPRARARAGELVEEWGLAPLARRRPDRLSGGERQRVAMARALAAEPEALLWDEPLSALDPLARGELLEVLSRALRSRGLPLVLVTHDAETAFSLADKFLVLDAGRVRFHGPGPRLCAAPPDPFSARFAGYENVFAPAELDRVRDEPFARYLRERSGPAGVCFSARAGTACGSPTFSGVVDRFRAFPEGPRLWLRVGGLRVSLFAPAAPALRLGAAWEFTLAEGAIRPLGASIPP
jgi:putative spermidine/putrescine transport system ATP-binding protein